MQLLDTTYSDAETLDEIERGIRKRSGEEGVGFINGGGSRAPG